MAITPSINSTLVPSVKPVYFVIICASKSVPPVEAFPLKTSPIPNPTTIPPKSAPSKGLLVHGSQLFVNNTINGKITVPIKDFTPNFFPE